MQGVTVVIPVGPEPFHQRWLDECVESVKAQTYPVDEILLIDDMAALGDKEGCRIWKAPWRLGAAGAINCGVSLARNDLVYILCADDWLEPECIAACMEEYERRNDPLGYYHVTILLVCEGDYTHHFAPLKDLPSGAALITKQLWRHTGGFPPDSSTSPDAMFISILYGKPGSGNLYHVRQGVPLCKVRMHPEQDSAKRGAWSNIIWSTLDLVTKEWEPPNWGRYE